MPEHTEDPPIACPLDGKTMDRVNIAGVAVDRCPECCGIWLDRGELRAILDSGSRGRARIGALDKDECCTVGERPNPLLCPRDHQRMSVHRDPGQKHIEYDLCPKCGGVFFDAGELNDLTHVSIAEKLKGMLG
ncbi:MAG: hypothetical protein DHS20C14_07450 [Phycisphaeraceae bacterium]|nr:MAG: hypothetical protein DHS20C14_07450 [Phycisphaeraceae bacterium]